MLDSVFAESVNYLEQMPKTKRKAIGQFITSPETAIFMASMFSIPNKEQLTIIVGKLSVRTAFGHSGIWQL